MSVSFPCFIFKDPVSTVQIQKFHYRNFDKLFCLTKVGSGKAEQIPFMELGTQGFHFRKFRYQQQEREQYDKTTLQFVQKLSNEQ